MLELLPLVADAVASAPLPTGANTTDEVFKLLLTGGAGAGGVGGALWYLRTIFSDLRESHQKLDDKLQEALVKQANKCDDHRQQLDDKFSCVYNRMNGQKDDLHALQIAMNKDISDIKCMIGELVGRVKTGQELANEFRAEKTQRIIEPPPPDYRKSGTNW